MKTPRQLTVEAFCRMEKDASWSGPTLDSVLSVAKLTARDRGFASALFYGTLVRRYTIDTAITPFLKRPLSSLDPAVKSILRTGVFQMLYLGSVPDHAAVSESVDLCRKMKKTSAASFVNAVLRGFLRTNKAVTTPANASLAETLAIEYSCPPHLVNYWLKAYGEENTTEILKHSVEAPPTFLRVNPLKTTPEELVATLAEAEISATVSPHLPNCLVTSSQGALNHLDSYKNGLFHIQDFSSQQAALSLDIEKNQRVLDCCAAPGGKTFVIAQELAGTGEVVSCDLYPQRVDEINNRNTRLGLSGITTHTLDMTQPQPQLGEFHRVLCDAPCSGFGSIRRRPEIKYQELDYFSTLPTLQLQLITNAAKYCKKGGILVYSTCTLSPKENEKVVEKFLETHPNFSLMPDSLGTVFLGEKGGDGFYIAKIKHNT